MHPDHPLYTRDGSDGFPAEQAFKAEMDDYVNSLNARKRGKALMSHEMYDIIFRILASPHAPVQATAQFRFWAKKMFRLVPNDGALELPHVPHPARWFIVHNQLPVAVKDDIYDILVLCHGQAAHGGRDKTAAQVRKVFSWIPKELIARFVKICPSCAAKRPRPLRLCSPSSSTYSSSSSLNSPTSPTMLSSSAIAGAPPHHAPTALHPSMHFVPELAFAPIPSSFRPIEYAPREYPPTFRFPHPFPTQNPQHPQQHAQQHLPQQQLPPRDSPMSDCASLPCPHP